MCQEQPGDWHKVRIATSRLQESSEEDPGTEHMSGNRRGVKEHRSVRTIHPTYSKTDEMELTRTA